MPFQKYLLILSCICWPQIRSLPCGNCPKQTVVEASSEELSSATELSSECDGTSKQCDDAPSSPTTTTATTTATAEIEGNSSSSEQREESGTVRTAILAIAVRTLSNGSSEEKCSSSDCNSNGICFGTRSKPLCLCFKGFCGALCKLAFCPGHSGCNGRGWCLATAKSAKCLCQTNYWGRHCERSINRSKRGSTTVIVDLIKA